MAKVASTQWSALSVLNKLPNVKNNNCRCPTTREEILSPSEHELCQSSWHWAQTTTTSCKAAAKNILKDLRFALFACKLSQCPTWEHEQSKSSCTEQGNLVDLRTTCFGFAAEEENDTRSYQNRGKSPEIQFLGGQTVGLALGAVVHLILPQLLLAGEGSQAAVQVDGLCLGSAALLNTFMFLHDLKGEKTVSDLEM